MKILVVQLGRIGDMILATPMYSAIKKLYPDSSLTVLASIPNHPVLKDNPNIDNVLILDKSPLKLLNLFHQIRKTGFDLLIDAKDHYSNEGRFIAMFSDAVKKIGYNRPGDNVYDIPIDEYEKNTELHYTTRCLKALVPLGYELSEKIPRPELSLMPESMSYVESTLKKAAGKKIIVINISASNLGKMWDNSKWKQYIESLNTDEVFPIVSYAPEDRDVAQDLLERVSINEFKSRSINDVIALISKAELLVTPDTSLVHVAAAFNVPLLGLYSGLDDFYTKFAPLSDVKVVLRSPKGIDGIKEISASELIEAYRVIYQEIL